MRSITQTLYSLVILATLCFSCRGREENRESKKDEISMENASVQKFQEFGSDLGPVFSANGKEIAFYSYLKSDPSVGRIFVTDKEGSKFRLLTKKDTIGMHTEPKWSADGSKIGYTSFLEEGARIMSINADGGELEELASVSENGYHMFSCWDQTGEGYYFFHWPQGGFTPDAYYAKGTEIVRLTTDGISCRPQMASNGNIYVSKIVDLENNVFDKYRINPETKEAVKAPEIRGFELSYDHFVINDEKEEGTTIILEDLEGNDLRALGMVKHKKIMFSGIDPNQKYVVYNTSFEDGAEIHMLEIDTGTLRKITSNE